MKKKYLKEKRLCKQVFKNEDKRFALKSIIFNQHIPYPIRWNSITQLAILSKDGIKYRLVNKCFLSKQRKRFNKLFRISRLVFLRLARTGSIYGIKKAIW